MPPEISDQDVKLSERTQVILHRYDEARRYGMPQRQALEFAKSEVDVGELRRLKRIGCPPAQAVKILL